MKILTGIKPTGKLHLGHYFSCIKPALELQKQGHDVELLIANLHAQNTLTKDEINLHMNNMYPYIPQALLYRDQNYSWDYSVQDVFFEMLQITPKGLLERCHAYKSLDDKQQANMGLLTYPVLMAVDIYLSGCDKVLVGQDQLQHIEVARELIKRFNKNAILPEPLVYETTQIPGFDGRKMSKSYNNTLPLDATDKEIKEFCRKIKTGTEVTRENSKIINHMFSLLGGFYEYSSYKQAKDKLTEVMIDFYNKEIR